MHIWTILLASGRGTRISGDGPKKQFLSWQNRPLYWHSVRTFAAIPRIRGVVITFPADEEGFRRDELHELFRTDVPGLEYTSISGGSTRQESVANALALLPGECTHVLVHDAARPFVRPAVITAVIDSLDSGAPAAVPSLPVTDTIKEQTPPGQVRTMERDRLYAVQTPQGFERSILAKAHEQAAEQQWMGTDDASLVERLGHSPVLVPGDAANIKITTNRDLTALREPEQVRTRPCIGWGYDVHRFGPGRPMKLGGVPITNGPEVIAHSDGDVLLHAMIDAILGCLGRGDIGDHFPDTDPAYAGMSSGLLLAETMRLAARDGFHLQHLDLTLITQIPKIGPWKDRIRKNLLALLGLDPEQINLKATTEEHLGFTGSKQGIKAVAQAIGCISKLAPHSPNSTPFKDEL